MESRQLQQSKDTTRRLLAEHGEHVASALAGAPETAEALRALCAQNGWSEQDLIFWLIAPTTRFGGARPVDLIATEPGLVLSAVETEMTTEW